MESSTTFVLDTNVLIDCPRAIDLFGARGNVTIPFMVITELDSLKGNPLVGHPARAARRELIKIFGAPNGELRLEAELKSGFSARVVEVDERFACSIIYKLDIGREHRNDARILATAIAQSSHGPTVIVSGDLWVRFHASKFGLLTEEIEPTREEMPLGLVVVEHAASSVTRLGAGESIIVPQKVAPLHPNQPVRVSNRCGGASAIGIVDADGKRIKPLREEAYSGILGIAPKDIDQSIAIHALLAPADEIPLVTIEGKAGSGKTLLALAAAYLAVQEGHYDRIIIGRSLEPVGKDVGYLKGTLEEKLDPWLKMFADNRNVIARAMQASLPPRRLEKGSRTVYSDVSIPDWEYFSITHLRGRTYSRAFIIIDEAQNLDERTARDVLTRAGEGTRIVLLGSPSQTDRHDQECGFRYFSSRGATSRLAAHVVLGQCHRSPLALWASEVH
jgi:PhoH-like ATPase